MVKLSKDKNKGLFIFVCVMAVTTVVGLGILFTIMFFPKYTHYAEWLLPIPSLIVCYFMIYSKEVIIKDNWARMNIVIKVLWWTMYVFNLYMGVKHTFDLFRGTN